MKKGLTIVEALVAIAILAVAMAALIPVFTNNARINNRMELRSAAVAAAQHVLDDLRIRPWPDWQADETVTVGGREFDVAVSWCAPGTADCLSTTEARHVRLEVSNDGTVYYQVATVYTRFE